MKTNSSVSQGAAKGGSRSIRPLNAPTIDAEVSTIFDLLSVREPKSNVVVKERPLRGSSCHSIIAVYKRDELARQHEEEQRYKQKVKGGADRTSLAKPYMARPLLKYAFYPSVYDPSRLGSVAIYGENAVAQGLLVKKRRVLFGHQVASATFESGIHVFMNVKFAS